MKSILFYLFFIIITLTSCSSHEQYESILGKWKVDSVFIVSSNEMRPDFNEGYFTFKKDSILEFIARISPVKQNGKWFINEGYVSIIDNGDTNKMKLLNISSNQMKLESNLGEGELQFYLNRVK